MTVGKSLNVGCICSVSIRCTSSNVFCFAFCSVYFHIDGHNDDCGEIFERLYGGRGRCGASGDLLGMIVQPAKCICPTYKMYFPNLSSDDCGEIFERLGGGSV